MNRAIYPGLTGATSSWSQMETVAHNLSNLETPGFKAARVAFLADGPGEGPLKDGYTQPSGRYTDMRDGPIRETGAPLDLALRGPGFFRVDVDGTSRLTRDGRFTLDSQGTLLTADGFPVQGDSGEIRLPPGEEVQILEDGSIRGSVSGVIGRLAIVDGPAKPIGSNLWEATGDLTDIEKPSVRQGAIEGSNVDPMAMMVELIQASRSFEAMQKSMQTADEFDQRLNQLGGR